ncbi:hypothetical protein Goshw_000267 [Gossypium schwendimanii]|uniref:DUF4283 domain-containing protein n=1 Tax=Gossypium schwendimanii TaxID=34291 RepID=A0A7J9N7H1_GOSSC|nr:hypothetical protein [Gossypium schwendimanii]
MVESISQFYLVGRCLIESVVHFPSLRNTMADLWHPIGGICITDIGEKWYLFQFFHEVNIARVLARTPWFFNNHLLIMKRIPYGGNPAMLELNSTEFWIQVHELPQRLMSESLAKQLGNFCGRFLEYDSVTPFLGPKMYMLIQLSLFCFICGKLGHGESFCTFRLRIKPSKIIFGWDLSLRAVERHQTSEVSKWLSEADSSQYFAEKLQNVTGGQDNGRNWGEDGLAINGLGKGPMDLVLEEENDAIALVEGKKRQRVVEEPSFEEMVRRWWEDIPGCVPSKLERIGHQMQK